MTPEFIENLSKIISINSISNPNPDLDQSNEEVIDLIANWLEDIGFVVDLIENNTDSQNTSRTKKQNLVAVLQPEQRYCVSDSKDLDKNNQNHAGRGLVWSGHTDTVNCDPDLWDFDPFELHFQDGIFTGLGVVDMKSFFPLIIETMNQLNISSKNIVQPITVVATADEEISMQGARTLFQKKYLHQCGELAVLGEPTSLAPLYAHKGMLKIYIRLMGKSGHSSDPANGQSALEGMNHFINNLLQYRDNLQRQWRNKDFSVPMPTLNLGQIQGGDSANRICGSTSLLFDCRCLPGMDYEQIQNDIQKMVGETALLFGLQAHFSPVFSAIPAMDKKISDLDLQWFADLCKKKQATANYATEAPFFHQSGVPAIILGAGDIEKAHAPNESVELKRLSQALNIYKSILQKYCMSKN